MERWKRQKNSQKGAQLKISSRLVFKKALNFEFLKFPQQCSFLQEIQCNLLKNLQTFEMTFPTIFRLV